MRIAYVAPYKSAALLERRSSLKNLSLSNAVKIELITRALRKNSHEVVLISPGEVDRVECKFYPRMSESHGFDATVPIHYASAWPIKYVNGLWSGWQTLRLLKSLHQSLPFDLLLVFNLRTSHIRCIKYAVQRLRLPTVLEYEDDSFVDIGGRKSNGLRANYHRKIRLEAIGLCSGAIAVSPHLLAQFPEAIPKLLLRGVVAADIEAAAQSAPVLKKNWMLFSGTHTEANGVAELIKGFGLAAPAGWELHVTGRGEKTEELKQLAAGIPGVVFHGLVEREQLVRLLCTARVCVNPQVRSLVPGNVFPFKVIEYLAAGAHVISTPLGMLEKDLEGAVTYMPDNDPATIANTLKSVIETGDWQRTASQAALGAYGLAAVAKSLNELLLQVVQKRKAA